MNINLFKNIKKQALLLTAALFAACFLTGCGTGGDEGTRLERPSVGNFIPAETSLEMANNMAIGWNLGNTLDSSGTDNWSCSIGLDAETYWGMPKTTKAMIQAVREAEFKTIRIPVSWHNHISRTDTTNYTIDSEWMARVKTIVDWAIDQGMCVILNVHHDNMEISNISTNPGYCLSDDEDIQAKSKAFLNKVWTQIATTFKDYDNCLVFEVLNEPRDKGGEWKGNEWWCNDSTVIGLITTYEKVCIDAIRAVEGNENRFIMVPGYAASGSDSRLLDVYKMPSDSATDRLLLSAHAYSPYDFAMNSLDDTTFDSADANSLTSLFAYLNKNYIQKGIGVVMGEASASDKNNTSERVKWAKDYFTKAMNIGIPVVLWDNMVLYANSSDPAESHGYLNRKTCTWYFPEIINAMMDAVYGEDAESLEDDTDDSDDDNTSTSDETADYGLLDNALDLNDSAWGVNVKISASKFSSAGSGTKLVFTTTACSDSTATYSNVKLENAGWTTVFDGGTAEGAEISEGVLVPAAVTGSFSYTPADSEWTEIKSTGLIVYGYGIKITKITLE